MTRVGIDVQIAGVSKVGIGYFTAQLEKRLPLVDQQHEYVMLRPTGQTADFSMPARWWWDQVTIPRLVRKERIDVLFKPAFSVPAFGARTPTVAVLHDLAARRFPSQLNRPSAWFYGYWAPWTLRFAKRVIAISAFTADEAVRLLGMSRDKLAVVLQGTDPVLPEADDAALLKRFSLPERFVLHVGTIEPRKNLAFLVRVFAQFNKKYSGYALVLAGKDGWRSGDVYNSIDTFGFKDSVRLVGEISDRERAALYRRARVLAFPSSYEGFGRPPLEAMALGTPVVAARNSSIPEVVGDAGLLVSGYDEGMWAEALGSAAEDETVRTRLRAAGLARAQQFDWDEACRSIARIVSEVAHD